MIGLELWLACGAAVVLWVAIMWRFVWRGADLHDEPESPLELVPARMCACGCGLPTSGPNRAYRFGHDRVSRAALVAMWRARAERLEAYARDCRAEGAVHGAEGAEDAESAAHEYRLAADELELELEARAREAASS